MVKISSERSSIGFLCGWGLDGVYEVMVGNPMERCADFDISFVVQICRVKLSNRPIYVSVNLNKIEFILTNCSTLKL
jgi:hypothetical protein